MSNEYKAILLGTMLLCAMWMGMTHYQMRRANATLTHMGHKMTHYIHQDSIKIEMMMGHLGGHR